MRALKRIPHFAAPKRTVLPSESTLKPVELFERERALLQAPDAFSE